MTTEQQDAVDDERRMGVEPSEPPRAVGGYLPDPAPGLALASFIIQNVAEAHRGRDNGDMGARYAYALGRLHQEAARFIREYERPVGGATVGQLAVTINAGRTEEAAERVRETGRRIAESVRATEPFHPDGDRAARGDEGTGPTAEDLEAWKSLQPGDVLGNVYKTASLGGEHGQTWLELMVGWDEDGPVPVPVVVTIRTGRGEWREPRVWEPRRLAPGYRRRVIAHPDLTAAPVALRRLVYPHDAAGALILGPETLGGPERVGEYQHPRLILHRGATYVLADDAPAVPGAKVQTLRAAWVAGEDELTARIGETVYVKVRPTREAMAETVARVPGEPRPGRLSACGYQVQVTQTHEEPDEHGGVRTVPMGHRTYGPCLRPAGHVGYHQQLDGQEYSDRGELPPF